MLDLINVTDAVEIMKILYLAFDLIVSQISCVFQIENGEFCTCKEIISLYCVLGTILLPSLAL